MLKLKPVDRHRRQGNAEAGLHQRGNRMPLGRFLGYARFETGIPADAGDAIMEFRADRTREKNEPLTRQ